jgi:hypothetical protein
MLKLLPHTQRLWQLSPATDASGCIRGVLAWGREQEAA